MKKLVEMPTVFDSSIFSFFIGNDFSDVFNNETIFSNHI